MMASKLITIEFVPYFEIERLDSTQRLEKLLKIVKQNKLVLLEGRLRKEEEAEMIAKTMAMIDQDFKGIELSVVFPNRSEDLALLEKLRERFISILLGDRQGFTIIGPANIVKEIKRDPNKIHLLTEELREQPSRDKKNDKKKKR